MSSIVFGGVDFAPLCSAQVVARSLNGYAVDSVRVAGRPGAVPTGAWMPPEDVRVRLFLEPGFEPGAGGMADARHRLRSWLARPGGATLSLPDEPGLHYRDAYLVEAGAWTSLLSDGECDVTFTLFDPIAYGALRTERTTSFEVRGTWPALPTLALAAKAGGEVRVAHAQSGRAIAIAGPFAGGEELVVDCERGRVGVDGADATARVSLSSDFFALTCGPCELALSGCVLSGVTYWERWL